MKKNNKSGRHTQILENDSGFIIASTNVVLYRNTKAKRGGVILSLSDDNLREIIYDDGRVLVGISYNMAIQIHKAVELAKSRGDYA